MKIDLDKTRNRLRNEGAAMPGLSERQSQVIGYMLLCWLSGYLPTVRELCDELGIRSPNGVQCHLQALEGHGLTEHCEGGYVLTDKALNWVLE